MTQIDHKVRQLQAGLGGAFCTCCDCTKFEANLIEYIQKGFPITCELEDIQALYDKLKAEGRLKSAKPKERNGVTDEPMLTPGGHRKSHQFISILHAKLNSLRWSQEMGHHYNSRDAFPDQIPIRGLGKKNQRSKKKQLRNLLCFGKHRLNLAH